MTSLHAALGPYRHTEALFDGGLLSLDDFPVIIRAFAPMVRTQCFQVSEMAVATYLMARAAGSDLMLLPVVMAMRFQNSSLLRRAVTRSGPPILSGGAWACRPTARPTGCSCGAVLQDACGVQPDQICSGVSGETVNRCRLSVVAGRNARPVMHSRLSSAEDVGHSLAPTVGWTALPSRLKSMSRHRSEPDQPKWARHYTPYDYGSVRRSAHLSADRRQCPLQPTFRGSA
jgi:hypothetical protein